MWNTIVDFFKKFGLWILGGLVFVILLIWLIWPSGEKKEKEKTEKAKTEISDPNAGGGNNNAGGNAGGGNQNGGGGNNNVGGGNQVGQPCKTETELMLEAQEAFLKKQREEAQVKKNIEEMVRNYNYTHTPIGGVGCDGSQKKTEKSSGTTIVYRERVVKEVEKPVERQVTTTTTSVSGSSSVVSSGSTPSCVIRLWNPDRTKSKDFPWTKAGHDQATTFCKDHGLEVTGLPDRASLPD